MKKKRNVFASGSQPWAIVTLTLMMVGVILLVVNQSIHIRQLSLISMIIFIVLLGSSYTLAVSLRYRKIIKEEVKDKTKEIEESHQRLLTVLDSLDAVVYVADMETFEILFLNKYTRDLYGDVVGKLCWKVLQICKSGPCDLCSNERLFPPDGNPLSVELREFQNPESGKWYEARGRAVPWIDGRMVRLEIAVDISDRKQAERELKQAHLDLKTFIRILKEIGGQQTLDGVATFLLAELQDILNTKCMLLYVFNDDRDILFSLSEKGSSIINEEEKIQTVKSTLNGLDGVTIAPRIPFMPPLISDSFPIPGKNGRQTIIPIRTDQVEGAFIVGCQQDFPIDENALNMVALVMEQTSGTIKRALLHEEELIALQNPLKITAEFSGIIGKDPQMQTIYKLIEDIAPTDATVLIQGESGTGKELVARAVHKKSPRKNKPFIVINCSAYPSTLLESELFGHEKGAFTGASRQKSGRFEQAHGGTVFLDEIGEIPSQAQIKLLRVLQTKKFERLGGVQTLNVDVRILAATNKDLLQEVKNSNFREDLFYRLNVIPIFLPSLKKRHNDIPLLAKHFLHRFAKEQNKRVEGFKSEAMRLFLDYPWPGNVRELENSVEHATVLSKGNMIEVSDLPPALHDVSSLAPAGTNGTLIENERLLLQEVLEECGWNKKQAAERLGISRSTLYGKLRKYEITKATIH